MQFDFLIHSVSLIGERSWSEGAILGTGGRGYFVPDEKEGKHWSLSEFTASEVDERRAFQQNSILLRASALKAASVAHLHGQ